MEWMDSLSPTKKLSELMNSPGGVDIRSNYELPVLRPVGISGHAQKNDCSESERSAEASSVMRRGLVWGIIGEEFLTVEGALVLLLYVSLLTEILDIARGRYLQTKGGNSHRKSRPLRPAGVMHIAKKACRLCLSSEKRNLRSLDNLWRRMQRATNQMRLIKLRHHMITKVMMEARMQARERERGRLQQRKERMFGGVPKPAWWTSAVRDIGATAKKACRLCLSSEKRNLRSLDNLWRRMQRATNQMRLIKLRHHMITKVMMEARMQARERERGRLQQRKERMFGGVPKPAWWTSAVRDIGAT